MRRNTLVAQVVSATISPFLPEGVSRLTVHSSASASSDPRPESFGTFVVRALLGEGRFGPVYVADDPVGIQSVVVRTFTRGMSADEQARLIDALGRLCETPLDHRSIARPLTAGFEHGAPFLIHTQLGGVPLDAFLRTHGPQPLQDVVMCLTQVAAAIDFAAAAGVHHGALTTADVILAPDGAGITGFGLVQALNEAGLTVEDASPAWAVDVSALAAMAFELLTGRAPEGGAALPPMANVDAVLLRQAFDSGLSRDAAVQPKSALEFAAALQHAIVETPRAVPAAAPAVDADEEAPTVVHSRPPLWDFTHADEPTFRDVHPPQVSDVEVALHDRAEPVHAVADVERPVSLAAPAMFSASSPAPRNRRGAALLVIAALVIGVMGGFAGGFITGQRGTTVPLLTNAGEGAQDDDASESANSTTVALDPAPATPPAATVPPVGQAPDAGAGAPQVVAPPIVQPEPERPAPAPGRPAAAPPRPVDDTPRAGSGSVARTETPEVAPAPPPATGPGSMQVLSRPDGAQVYVDGAFVGRTPVVLATVTPGPHDVRIELDGHQRWETTVRVEAGERTRVAASLEQ